MFHLRTPLTFLFLFVISLSSAQQYWKNQWVPTNSKAQMLKTDEGSRWKGDFTLIKKALSTKEKINIVLPQPNGELLSFDLKEERVMARELAEKYPDIHQL
jgi:hypothetical protein